MVKVALKAVALMLLCGSAWAGADEASCRNFAGQRIYTQDCKDYWAANPPMKDIDCANSPECRAAAAARNEAAQRRRDEERAADLAALAKEEKALRDRCKADLNRPRIGMPLARALDCTEGLGLIAEETTARGVLRTYGDGANYLRAAGGKVVAVGRY